MRQRPRSSNVVQLASLILAIFLFGTETMSYGQIDQTAQESIKQEPVASNKQDGQDRIWLLSTRSLVSRATQVSLDQPAFEISKLSPKNLFQSVSFEQFIHQLAQRQRAVIYVHGNRFTADDAIARGCLVHANVAIHEVDQPVDWVIWSWESDKNGILVRDARLKANRTEGQGLYLGWLLRKHANHRIPTTLVGYSFGGRVVTGALHAAAGGELGGVSIAGEATLDGPFNAALIAPAIDSLWLDQRGYHRLATQNLDRLTLLYNRRDAVLKRYWLIDRVQGRLALGYTGPRNFAPRFDGSSLPVLSRDCSESIGVKHDELYYFQKSCHAGREIATLIDQQPAAE